MKFFSRRLERQLSKENNHLIHSNLGSPIVTAVSNRLSRNGEQQQQQLIVASNANLIIREEVPQLVDVKRTLSKKISSYSMNGSEPDLSSEKKTYETLNVPIESALNKHLSISPKPVSPMDTPRERKELFLETPRKNLRSSDVYKRIFCFGTPGIMICI
jgi:hypothetical protein